ncbi:uncharacterized protein LOC124349085 isoform X1 [Daphnia pulicaria]|uniref:uncharacterized protein LOC124349085 isoform X1 n=1 Tax=Daphnia pulicaria TaxID=35523 RepID=UPI001EEC09DD|nr:uncharacterized protein LOC124349085 isoform X1 [Daphnia pulicaria]
MYVRDFVLLSLTFLLCLFTSRGEAELWREDVTGRMNIGVTASGFDQIRLDCGSNNFQVVVETLADFRGVIYTRGSFYSRKAPCFLDANGGRRFRLKIPYDQCNVEDDGEKFQVTLILQHDKELIMPGDGAFALQCDLSAKDSKSFKVSAVSSISLADPDPSGKDVPTHLKSTVSAPNVVIFKPSDIRPRKSPQRIEL